MNRPDAPTDPAPLEDAALECPECGALNRPSARFCRGCARSLKSARESRFAPLDEEPAEPRHTPVEPSAPARIPLGAAASAASAASAVAAAPVPTASRPAAGGQRRRAGVSALLRTGAAIALALALFAGWRAWQAANAPVGALPATTAAAARPDTATPPLARDASGSLHPNEQFVADERPLAPSAGLVAPTKPVPEAASAPGMALTPSAVIAGHASAIAPTPAAAPPLSPASTSRLGSAAPRVPAAPRVAQRPLVRDRPAEPGPQAAPAPAQTAAAASPAAPAELCAGSRFIAHALCLQRACERAEVRNHPQCRRLRDQQSALQHGSGEN